MGMEAPWGTSWPTEVKTGAASKVLLGCSEFDIDNNNYLRFANKYENGLNITADGISLVVGAGWGAKFREVTMRYLAVFD